MGQGREGRRRHDQLKAPEPVRPGFETPADNDVPANRCTDGGVPYGLGGTGEETLFATHDRALERAASDEGLPTTW